MFKTHPKVLGLVVYLLIFVLALMPFLAASPMSAREAEAKPPKRDSQSDRFKQLAAKREGETKKSRDAKRQAFLEERRKLYEDVELNAPYWAVGNGFETTIILNNTFTRTIDITPTVYTNSGQQLRTQLITLHSLESRTILLRDLTHVEGYGQLGLQFNGEPLEIHGSVIISNAAKSISINHRFEHREDATDSRMDGVFYVPSRNSTVRIALSNTTGQNVDAAVAFTEEGSDVPVGPKHNSVLGPHETQLLDVAPFLSNNPSGHAVAAIVTHTSQPGDLQIHGMVIDEAMGYSANGRFLAGSALIPLALTSPVYEHRDLTPLLVLNNTTGAASRIQLIAQYTLNGQRQEVSFGEVPLQPHSATHANLGSKMRGLPADAVNIGLRIREAEGKDGILADVLLIDNSGSQVLQLYPKGYAGEIHPSHGFPFQIGESLDTIITVANPSDVQIEYDLHLFYDGQSYTYDDAILQPGEIKHIDVRALRDQQIPGQQKALIPKAVTFGQGKVNFHPKAGTPATAPKELALSEGGNGHQHHQTHGAMMGGVAGATILDSSGKMSYATVCEGIIDLGVWYVSFGSIQGVVGDNTYIDLSVILYDESHYFYVTPDYIGWSQYDPSVVSANGNSISLVGPGYSFLEFYAPFTFYYYTYNGYYIITWVVDGTGEAYVYQYNVSITDLQFDEVGDGNFIVNTDGPPWAGGTLSVVAHRNGDSDVSVFSAWVGNGQRGIGFLENQSELVPSGDYNELDAVWVTGAVAQPIAVQAVSWPVNFAIVPPVQHLAGGVLKFEYRWRSRRGGANLADLANCEVGEYVTYPSAQNPYHWPGPPPWGGPGTDNPTVGWVAANLGPAQQFFDTHSSEPFAASATFTFNMLNSFTASQTYRYRCANINGNAITDIQSQDISRQVYSTAGGWQYEISKSSEVHTFAPIP